MPDNRPVVLIVDDNRESFETLLGRLKEFDDGRLYREFEFLFFDCYGEMKNWYVRNQGRFVSLIVQDVDFRDNKDPRKIVSPPREWHPLPTDFDPISLQGMIIFGLLRHEQIDQIVPVLFVSSHIGLHRSREFAEYLVQPGHGLVSFVPEDALGEKYYPEVIRFIDEQTLRPLTDAQRAAWRDEHGMVVGRSRRMAHLCYETDRIAPSDAIVLLMGEPGVGKELVARAIHRKSARYDPNDPNRQRPWTVNIAALEKSLVEDELFGHFRGAYTDATTSRMGIFEAADGSTVFLDEIGDLSKEVQLKLLRVMEYREIKKLGSSQEMAVDNRIIAATNRSPQELYRNSRPDFIGRLVQHCLVVPGFRNRWEGDSSRIVEGDIRELVEFFLQGMNRKLAPDDCLIMTEVAMRFIYQSVQEYVGGSNRIFTNNIRTIKNVVERAFERAQAQRKKEITLGEIVATVGMIKLIHREAKTADLPVTIEQLVGSLRIADVERRVLVEAMRKTENVTEIAKIVGLHRDTLRYKLSEYGLTEKTS